MDLIDRLRELSAKVPKLKQEGLKTEEATKNALVMPFIMALGYNVFDPGEVNPELIADMGTKKGEKVDYAILKDGKPIMLFECKILGTDLRLVHASQLYRYFSVTAARFGVLTDGVAYRFYTDLDAPNKMDAEPFFIFDLTDIKEAQVEELKRFSKASFDMERIVSAASKLKYQSLIKNYLATQFTQPSEAFVRVCLQESKAYGGRFTQPVIDEFTPIVRDSLRIYLNEQVENRLKSALTREEDEEKEAAQAAALLAAAEESKVVTTEEEREAYFIVKSILRETVDSKRINIRDHQTYCAILLDDNRRKTICRLYLDGSKKYLGMFDNKKEETRVPIQTIDDIFKHADQLKTAVAQFEKQPSQPQD